MANSEDVASTLDAIGDKTLVAWVRLDNLEQRDSGVLAIQDGDEFDAITYGERAPGRWMAGSHMFHRTQSEEDQQALAVETTEQRTWRQITVVYRGRSIEIFRDGHLYASYETPQQQTFSPKCDLYLGLRCIFGQKGYGFLQGAIDEARIYTTALDGQTIARLNPGVLAEPKPYGCWTFDGDVAKDLMGHYQSTQLVGTARVEDGALLLDGQGYAVASNRIPVDYRPPTVQAGFYSPKHRVGEMWDTWLYWHDGVYYMYYIAGPGGHWDAHEIAISHDGVHWEYGGVAVEPRPHTTWIGTGHVWKSPIAHPNNRWILNYSEWVGDKQDIMFATSPDLVHWTKVDEPLRFVQDTRWYQATGRWDCIDVVAGEDGYLYGYFTADPDPAKVETPHCGFGCARSQDGIRWEALPPPKGDMNGEFGGIQKIGSRYFITMSEGRVGVGASPRGPFWGQKKNHNVFGGDIYFPRFFHTAPAGPLMNHFFKGGPVFAAPLKAIEIDREGVLRVVWWPGNEILKAAPIAATIPSTPGSIHWLEGTIDVNQTTVMEGTACIPSHAPPDQVLGGIVIDQGDGTVECVAFQQTQTLFGDVSVGEQPFAIRVRQTANRDIDFGCKQKFRIVLNRDMMEVYVNDYLTILARVRNTGRIGLLIGDEACTIEDIRLWRSATASSQQETASNEKDTAKPPYLDGRPRATMRLDAIDQGVVLAYGDGPDDCDKLGAREASVFESGGTYYLHYDGAGPRGWRACLATSDDLVHWTKKGPVLDFGAPGEPDSACACSPWVYFDGELWHMFYVATDLATPGPDFIPAVPYVTCKARSAAPGGPWVKQRDVIPFRPQPDTYYSDTANAGAVVKHDNEYLMFFSAATAAPFRRTLGIARTRDLNGPWVVDPQPVVPLDEQIENSSLYFESSNQTWFLFTNHVGVDARGEYTDAVWVYWSKDLNQWDARNKAIVLDQQNSNWSPACIGMPTVVRFGDRLALLYDGPGGGSVSHMRRSIGLAWLTLPLTPPTRSEALSDSQ